ncbi:hypothetical protein ASPCADRAFT_208319 [Aspergillus carbonarius ITEM 5010]|uniref:Uncharacterized protein n=1 Tax=Aspergillus carbonarius (strain ITEM 5010) TaxID=602072 RepID=A0A1R3RJJ2_ASPC5|nr:hypothetical protein ASPCADRAFT_208319 [Aspergillus carbonarius ITEM 5010]
MSDNDEFAKITRCLPLPKELYGGRDALYFHSTPCEIHMAQIGWGLAETHNSTPRGSSRMRNAAGKQKATSQSPT